MRNYYRQCVLLNGNKQTVLLQRIILFNSYVYMGHRYFKIIFNSIL